MKHKFLNKEKASIGIIIVLCIIVVVLVRIGSLDVKGNRVGYTNEIEEDNTYFDKDKNLFSTIHLKFNTNSKENYQYQIYSQKGQMVVAIPELNGIAEIKIYDEEKEIYNKEYNAAIEEDYITVENKIYYMNIVLDGKGEVIVESK